MQSPASISVVVPAHNEESYILPCLIAIGEAKEHVPIPVETVVVLNRCTDGTERIARSFGATLVKDESRCISRIRNLGVKASFGEAIVTCDADSRLHPSTLSSVVEELANGAVGGGVDVRADRNSRGIAMSMAFIRLMARLTRVSAGAFWTTRDVFDAIGGFDERLLMAEDYDFARRLRGWGKDRKMPFRTLWDAPLTTSSRKFDRFGDWVVFRMLFIDAWRIRRSMTGKDREFVDEFFYDFEHKPSSMIAHKSR
jgi:glycosyltransferase involved in cell wall biosynthesis